MIGSETEEATGSLGERRSGGWRRVCIGRKAGDGTEQTGASLPGERTNEGCSVWVPTPWRARQQSGKEELDFSHSKQTLQQESLQKLGLGGLEVFAAESETNWTPGTWWPDFSPHP